MANPLKLALLCFAGGEAECIASAEAFCGKAEGFQVARLGGSWCCAQEAPASEPEEPLGFYPAPAAGISKQGAVSKWQSRPSPAHVLSARHVSRVLADLAVEKGMTWRVRGAQGDSRCVSPGSAGP